MAADPSATKARGEIGEIRVQLDSLSKFGGVKPETVAAKKELFKKIINYTTIGIDMSSLFMQVIKCAASSNEDVVLKKMLYLFLTTHAQSNPDLTLLTVNLLIKDCRDQDPSIRGLALRTLCSMRSGNMVEYLVQPVQQGLQDQHPYVRRTAVLGVLKIHHLDEALVHDQGLLDTVKSMALNDSNAQVVSNCLSVLERVGETKALVQRQFVVSLMNRIKDFSEWGQCQVLEIVSHFRPANEDEVYDIMNVLDDRLNHSNSAVVLSTIKVFLHLTLQLPATHQQVMERVVTPLQTLVSRDQYESAYAVLCNVRTLAQRAPYIFAQIYPTLFCRVHEPSYIKRIKLDILATVADEGTAYEIVTELTEYVNDIDTKLAREAVNAVGQIALRVPDVAGIVERLLGFLEVGKEHITAETLIQMKDLLRRYPDISEVCIASIGAINPADIEEAPARAAFIWILGQYGHNIQDAPYLLEPLINGFAQEEVGVRLALLAATAKLFFKRPPECQSLLGQVLKSGIADSNLDVRDRALLYFRLLQRSIDSAKEVISVSLPGNTNFSEEQSPEILDRIFDEFNSLSVVYNLPAAQFLDEQGPMFEAEPESSTMANGHSSNALVDESSSLLMDESSPARADRPADIAPSASGNGMLLMDDDILGGPVSTAAPGSAAPSGAGGMDLLGGLDDLLGGLGVGGAPAASAPPPPPQPAFRLRPQPVMSPAEFQGKWGSLQTIKRLAVTINAAAFAALEANKHQAYCSLFLQAFLRYMNTHHLATIASGGAAPTYRFYFHAQAAEPTTARMLLEIIASKPTAALNMTIKSDDPASLDAFSTLLEQLLKSFS